MLDNLLDFSGIACTDEMIKEEKEQVGIAIIGMSSCFADSKSKEEFWEGLIQEKSSVRAYPNERAEDVMPFINQEKRICNAGYFESIDKYDYEFFGMSYNEACFTDPNQRMLLETVYHALENAGYACESIKGSNTGVYIGQSADLSIEYSDLIERAIPERYHEISVPGNIKSIMAGRIAYYFDLQGPAMVIDTACSSALVAVVTACDALKNGTIDLAIVGGVKVDIFPVQDGLDNEIGIRSSIDKLCAFDDSSDGISSGEGTAAIILKNMKKAVEDGDHIHAVIKGYAVNNDGNSIGVTAPNPAAQEKVICKAWNAAEIKPDDLDYIESHGTGTKLGDPIEIEALTKAFARYTNRKNFCAVGSVKTNLGHLDNLAGMASIFKVVSILKNGELPASLHFLRPNRKINFIQSALYVNDISRRLSKKDKPYLCGINSFGLAGTNCHLVIEEYNEKKVENKKPEKLLFVVSAKKAEQLEMMCNLYVEYLEQHEELAIEDICYTAMAGRFYYSFRAAFLVKNRKELLAKLKEFSRNAYAETKGQVNEGIRVEMQGLCLKYLTSYDEEVLNNIAKCYLKGAEPLAEMLFEGQAKRRCELPEYPFERTRCWIEAHRKNNLIDKCLVRTKNEVIYQTEFSNKTHWILHEHKVNGKYVLPGTAYIEALFTIIDQFAIDKAVIIQDLFYLKPLVLKEGETRQVITSLRTSEYGLQFEIGSWDEDEWIQQAMGTIQLEAEKPEEKKKAKSIGFNEHEQKVAERRISVEIGRHWTEIERSVYKISDVEYETFFKIPNKFYADATRTRVYAPALDRAMNVVNAILGDGTYLPFSFTSLELNSKMPLAFYSDTIVKEVKDSMIKVDVTLFEPEGKVFCKIKDFIVKKIEQDSLQSNKVDSLFHEVYWKKQQNVISASSNEICICILLKEDTRTYKMIKNNFKNYIFIYYGSGYLKLSENSYETDSSELDYIKILEDIKGRYSFKIVNALALNYVKSEQTLNEIEQMQEMGILSLMNLVKALKKAKNCEDAEIIILTNNTAIVDGAEQFVLPCHSALSGAARVVTQEFADLSCRCIDWDEDTEEEKIVQELNNTVYILECVYRKNIRYVKKMRKVDFSLYDQNQVHIQQEGVYVIAGGSGDLGKAVAEWIRRNAGKVVLLGRQAVLQEPMPDGITYRKCDIVKDSEVKSILEDIRSEYGKINGVVQCAGVVKDNLLFWKDKEEVLSVLKPKMHGTWLLDQYTQKDDLDFFILFSSVSAIVGGAGQFDYAAANAYLDAYSQSRAIQSENIIAINWAAWSEIGMAYRAGLNENEDSFYALKPREAIKAMEYAIEYSVHNIVIGEPNKRVLTNIINKPVIFDDADELISFPASESKVSDYEYKTTGDDELVMLTKTETVVAKVWHEVLGNRNMNIHDSFDKLGGNSIMAVRMLTKLNKIYRNLDITMIYSYPTIHKMAAYINSLENKVKEPRAAKEENKEEDVHPFEDIDKILEQLENREILVSDAVSKLS